MQEVAARAEAAFEWQDPELSYWWTGFKDRQDTGAWTWAESELDKAGREAWKYLLVSIYHPEHI